MKMPEAKPGRRVTSQRLFTSTPALIVALWAIWSTVIVATKVGLEDANPSAFILMRMVIAPMTLASYLSLSSARRLELVLPRAHRAGLALGITNISGFMILHTVGLELAGVAISSVLIYTQPLLVAIGATWLLHERLSPRQGVGLVAGWAGVGLIVAGELVVGGTPPLAILLLLGSAVFWAAGTLAFKKIGSVASPSVIVFLSCAYGLPPIIVFAGLSGMSVNMTSELSLALAWAALGIVGGYGLQFRLLSRGKAGVVSSWIFPVPVITSLLGVLLFGEALRAELAVGALAVALGIYLVNVQESGDAKRESPCILLSLYPAQPHQPETTNSLASRSTQKEVQRENRTHTSAGYPAPHLFCWNGAGGSS
jgi:drug/metabolite transporter (DMT)-like permease